MAVVLAGGCRVSEMREGASLVQGTLRIWNRIGRATGAQAISLRVMEFAPGLSPGIRNDDCDEILYVLDEVRTAGLLIDGVHHEINPDTGIYLRPGETLAINNSGPDPVVLVSSQCPDPDREPEFVEALTLPISDLRV